MRKLADLSLENPEWALALLDDALISSHGKMYVAWALGMAATDRFDAALKERVAAAGDDELRLGALRGLYPYRRVGILRTGDLAWYEQALGDYIKAHLDGRNERLYERDVALNVACKFQLYSPSASRLIADFILSREDVTVTLLSSARDGEFFPLVASIATSHPSAKVRAEAAGLLGDAPGMTRVHQGYVGMTRFYVRNKMEINDLNRTVFAECCEFARSSQGYAATLTAAESTALDQILVSGRPEEVETGLSALRKVEEAINRVRDSYTDAVVPTVVGLLQGGTKEIKTHLLMGALGAYVDKPDLAECLWRVVENDPDPFIRSKAIDVLSSSKDTGTVAQGFLRAAEQDSAWEVRTVAVSQLFNGWNSYDRSAVERSVSMVREWIRAGSLPKEFHEEIFDALRRGKASPPVRSYLSELAGGNYPEEIRQAAKRALEKD